MNGSALAYVRDFGSLSIRPATATAKAVYFLMKGMRRGPRRRLRTVRSAKTRLTSRVSSRLASPLAIATATTGARPASSCGVADPAMSAIEAKAAETVVTEVAFRAISSAIVTARVATGAISLRASSFISGRREVRRAMAPRRSFVDVMRCRRCVSKIDEASCRAVCKGPGGDVPRHRRR